MRMAKEILNDFKPDVAIGEGGMKAMFSYRGDGSRAGMTVTDADGDTVRTADYRDRLETWRKVTGGVEQEKSVLWLGGSAYNAPAALVKEYGSDTWALHYVLRDNLGSILAVTDDEGSVQQRLAYDAWGALCDPSTGNVYPPDNQPELLLGRGYTGHEHLPEFGLINMNARLYDPALGRFLSPDPVVQLLDNTQSYNRYSYCLNNPLRYVDLTGLKWLMSKFGNEFFIFYDDRVNNIVELVENYRNHSDITILDDDVVVQIRDKETGEISSEFELFSNGDFSQNGKIQNGEYNRDGLLHIGSTNFTNSNTIANNYHGSYLGPHNPQLIKGGDSYAVPPGDLHDYFAFQHDKYYDMVGAEGFSGALFNTNTALADLKLSYDMNHNMDISCWGWITYKAFEQLAWWKVFLHGTANQLNYYVNKVLY